MVTRVREYARDPRLAATAAIAVIAGFALVGCSGLSRDLTSGVSGGSSGAAVSPAEISPGEKGTLDEAASAPAVGGRTASAPALPGDAPLPSVGEPRAIIRNGSADLEVRSVAEAFESVRQIATAAGGTVADSSFTGSSSNASGNQQSAQLTLRVPVDRFGDVLVRLREVAVEVRSITTGSRDVTDEYTDVEATLRNLRAVETQYMQLLGRAGSIGDVLQVQDRLNQVRLQIDRTEARRQSLAARAEMSTIAVSLRPVSGLARGSGPLAQARAAWEASLATLTVIATVLLVAAVYSWWIIPFVVAGFLVARRMRRQSRAATPAVTPPTA